MTSTSIFSGKEETRNSSRVLRPPGGGHTDVLGVGPAPTSCDVKRPSPRNISSITEGTNAPGPLNPNVEPQPAQNVVVEKKEQPPATSAPPSGNQAGQRVRVPPGGFSSGLW